MKKIILKNYKRLPKSLKKLIKNLLPKGFVRYIWFRLNSNNKNSFIFNYESIYKNENAYEKYLAIQKDAFERKIENQWETEENILLLSKHLNERFNSKMEGVCHGTRTGKEQAWFNKHLLNDSYVFGTDIGSNLEKYPNTIYFDMNNDNLDWKNKFDFIYSNSWDHSFNPHNMFKNWLSHLKNNGILILNHTAGHDPQNFQAVSETDPVAISAFELENLFKNLGARTYRIDGKARNDDESLKPWIYICIEKIKY